ncbi:MAG: endodeoxyribonuclease RusA [Alphaproteobacteria bacterium]|nr:MAG: endodeoxyribonuclease RusA [Alphaproteobacteria bacterium]
MICVSLPWPSGKLLPNARSPGAWRIKQQAAKAYRADCAIVCRAQGLERVDMDRAHLTIRFCPPDRRRRDLDNMLAAFKHGLDAIAESIGIDDQHFGLTILRGEPVKGGTVEVSIGGGE